MNEHREEFNKELENTKKNQTELKKTITCLKKTTLREVNSGLDDTEE